MNRGRFGLAFSAAAFTAAGVILLTPLVTAGADAGLCDLETATAGATVTYGAGEDGCTPLSVTYGDDFAPMASSSVPGPAYRETRAEMACKDVAAEGDESRIAARFKACERKHGALLRGGMVECRFEDGSGKGQRHPCFWDASSAGNGVGLSFVVTRRHGALCFTYLRPAAQAKHGGCS